MPSSDLDNGKSQGRGRSNSLPAHVVDYLKAWIMSPEHISHPYPTEKEKAQMVADTGIEIKRLNNWFVNNRIRYWKPRMEALQRQKQNSLPAGPEGDQAASGVLIAPSSRWVEQTPANASRFHNPVSPLVSGKNLVATFHSVRDASTSANVSVSSGDDDSLGETSTSPRFHNPSPSNFQLTKTINSNPRKRNLPDIPSPRSKYSRKDADLWRKACLATSRLHCESLPTLDEAARLFGFSSES